MCTYLMSHEGYLILQLHLPVVISGKYSVNNLPILTIEGVIDI